MTALNHVGFRAKALDLTWFRGEPLLPFYEII
jgi:hypothetical protein